MEDKFMKITSSSNPLIKEAVRIRERHGKVRNTAFLIEGPHLVEMALASPDVEIKRVFVTDAFLSKKEGQHLVQRIVHEAGKQGGAEQGAFLLEVSGQILDRLTDTEAPQGIAAVVSYRMKGLEELQIKDAPLLAVCDGIQDPGNLGAIIRASDAAGADAVVILPGTCDAFMQKTIRSTAGSLFTIPLIYSSPDSLAAYLDLKGITLSIADAHAKRFIYAYDFRKPVAIAFGSEAHGASNALRQKAKDLIVIPVIGKAESLNVAMAASVCLYEAVRQRRFAQPISHFLS